MQIPPTLSRGLHTPSPEIVSTEANCLHEMEEQIHDAADEFSDQLHDFLVRKNGSPAVQRDREDKAIRAAFEAFTSTIEYSGLKGMATGTEALITGAAADIK